MTVQYSSLKPGALADVKPKDRLGLLRGAKLHTRAAPSPTGYMHLGTLRTMWHNFLLAKLTGGQYLLRIDDTDRTRNQDDAVRMIYDLGKDYGIHHNRTFLQSSRFDHYKNIANQMIDQGIAQYIDGAIVMGLPDQKISFFDLALGHVSIPMGAKHIVLIKTDGTPSYHFASVIDDIDFDITLILRGGDHLANTSRHIFLAKQLSHITYPKSKIFLDGCLFGHVGLITKDKKKLSKRDTDSNVMLLKNDPPKSILHWVTQLGWSHPSSTFDRDVPIFSSFDFFLDGGFRPQNMDINLGRLSFLRHSYKKDYDPYF